MTELIVSVVGGVITALILSAFSGRRGTSASVSTLESTNAQPAQRRRSAFGDFIRMLVAVSFGIAIAMIGGRLLIQAGLLPRGLPTRLGLLVAGTAVCWLLLVGLRRK